MSEENSLERALSVVQALYKRTYEGKINWQPSRGYSDAFEADFGELGVVMQEVDDPDQPEDPDYVLRVIEKPIDTPIPLSAGRVIESISNTTLRPLMDRTTEAGLNPYVVLRNTFEMARRKAFKVDEKLEDLLQKLGGAPEA